MEDDFLRVRFRIDGLMQDLVNLPKQIHSEIVSRIKILANLRIDEHASAQDGRFRISLPKVSNLDIRASIIPAYYGEKVVMRLLVSDKNKVSFDSLGFTSGAQQKINQALSKTSGLILVSGPTGSGKTTTLYSMLESLNQPEVSIVTIEDPIEYAITGLTQIQVNSRSGITFSNGLRNILRQDPDIIMVGEIRDNETAAIVINASLTGHLVLSTLHTSSAIAVLPRLIDMQIEPYLIASTVNLIIAQRLLRKICQKCKTKYSLTQVERDRLEFILSRQINSSEHSFFYGKGCVHCQNSGFQGRVMVQEVLDVDKNIRQAILSKASEDEMGSIARQKKMLSILDDTFNKALSGQVNIQDIFKLGYD